MFCPARNWKTNSLALSNKRWRQLFARPAGSHQKTIYFPPPSLWFRVHLIVCLIKSHFSNRNEDDNKTKAKTIANSLWPNKIKRKHVNKNKKVFFLNEERTSIAPRNEHFPPFNADQNKNKNIKKWKREFGIKRQWTLLKKRLKNKNKSVENKSTCQTQLSLLC